MNFNPATHVILPRIITPEIVARMAAIEPPDFDPDIASDEQMAQAFLDALIQACSCP